MIDSTELAMQLAQLKLDLRKLTDPQKGISRAFDASICRAISGLDAAIVNSLEAVATPNIPPGSRRKRYDSAEASAIRHAHWLEKQYQAIRFNGRRPAP